MIYFKIAFLTIAIICLVVSVFFSNTIISFNIISPLFTKAHKVSASDIRLFFLYLSLALFILWFNLRKYNKTIESFGKWSHVKELDGIRALAVISIILFHWQPYGNYFPAEVFLKNLNFQKGIGQLLNDIIIFISQFGYLAVGVFIILSGLSLSMSYYSNILMNRKYYWKIFYLKRCMRILPLYWIVLLISFLLAYYYGKHVTLQGFLASFLLLQNYYLPWHKELALANQPLWFIPLLIVLYIFFPALLWLRRALGDPMFVLLLIGFSIIYFNTFIWIVPLGRLGEFGFGIVLGKYLLEGSNENLKLLTGFIKSIIIGILFVTLVYFTSRGLRYSIIQPILPILLFLLFWNLSFLLSKSNSFCKIFFWLAGGSYAAYLIHPLLLRLLPDSLISQKHNIIFGLAFMSIVFLISSAIVSIDKQFSKKFRLLLNYININILINRIRM